ncbi:MAG: HDIG domain-containing metalloprotein, partial [Syntrophobacteraceae bacterium]
MLLTRTECLDYLIKINMPPHIRRHCMLVAEVALFLGKLLNRNGLKLSLPLIENGALLHDVGKEKSLTTGEDHAELGARMLTGLIAPAAVRIVREHIFLEPWHLNSPVDESLLVNYSDKRVRHEEIVSIEARYLDLIERYAKTPAHRGRLIEKLSLYRRLE